MDKTTLKGRLIASALVAFTGLTLAASAPIGAFADHCEEDCTPPPPTGSTSCTAAFQGWDGEVYVNALHQTFYAIVVQEPTICEAFHTQFFVKVARQFIRYGTVYPLADPDVWSVRATAER